MNESSREPIAKWEANGIPCMHLPDDGEGRPRITIGGGISADYCNIRGDIGQCIELMEKAVAALKESQ